MTKNEREKLPPPPECRQCRFFDAWMTPSGERSQCVRGIPMHGNCVNFRVKGGVA